jgi:hypothetical protein
MLAAVAVVVVVIVCRLISDDQPPRGGGACSSRMSGRRLHSRRLSAAAFFLSVGRSVPNRYSVGRIVAIYVSFLIVQRKNEKNCWKQKEPRTDGVVWQRWFCSSPGRRGVTCLNQITYRRRRRHHNRRHHRPLPLEWSQRTAEGSRRYCRLPLSRASHHITPLPNCAAAMSPGCHPESPGCHPDVTRMSPRVTRMSPRVTRMSPRCHPDVTQSHPDVTQMSPGCQLGTGLSRRWREGKN